LEVIRGAGLAPSAALVLVLRALGGEDAAVSSELILADRSCTIVADIGDLKIVRDPPSFGESSRTGLVGIADGSGCGLMICDAPFRYVK
jgi:hypothetical protein